MSQSSQPAAAAQGGSLLGSGMSVTWYGHAAFRITTSNGQVILIDPWLENPKAPQGAKDSIQRADVILVTHGHFDHLGNTVELAKRLGSKVVTNFEMSVYLGSQGIPEAQAIGMNQGGTVAFDGFKVTMVDAVHSSGISGDQGIVDGGSPGGYVIRFDNGTTLYHSGDTNVFGDMRLIAELYSPSVAMLPIGGFYTMSPFEAARAVRLLGVKSVIPMHYGTFPALAGTPDELARELGDANVQVVAMTPGQTISG